MLTETWFDNSINDAELSMNSTYQVFRCDRPSRGGGVCVLIRGEHGVAQRFADHPGEHVCVDLLCRDGILRFLCCYFTPTGTAAEKALRMSDLCSLITAASSTDSPIFIVGDFNLPGINWSDPARVPGVGIESCFVDCCADVGLTQLILQPTQRAGGILDLLLTGDPDLIDDLEVIPPPVFSDHMAITFRLMTDNSTPYIDQKFRPGRLDEFAVMNHLQAVSWKYVFRDCTNVDDMYLAFIECCSYLIGEFRSPPTQPSTITRINGHLIRLQRKVDTTPDADMAALANKLRKASTRYRQLIETDLNLKDSRSFFRYANTRLRSRERVAPLEDAGTLHDSDADKATLLARHFSSIYTAPSDSSTTPYDVAPRILRHEDCAVKFTEYDIFELTKTMKSSFNATPDNIPPYFYNKFGIFLAEPLKLIYERSLTDGTVPQAFRHSIVTPIFKKGSKSSVSNYRPISQGTIACKILEKLVYKHILTHLQRNELMDCAQHGFVPNRSTCTQLLKMTQDFAIMLNERVSFHCIMFDQRSAFDKVPTEILMAKLKSIGLHQSVLSWLNAYLTQRTFTVKVMNTESAPFAATSGVPQGSCLSPLLYSIFVLDIALHIPTSVSYLLYADDLKLYSKVSPNPENSELQIAVNGIVRWCRENGMFLSSEKTVVLKNGRDDIDYEIDGTTLTSVKVAKDLGVLMSADLNFAEHIGTTVRKCLILINMIFRCLSVRKPDVYIRLFQAIIIPKLTYCSPIWRPYLVKHITAIENVRRRFLRRLKLRCGSNESSAQDLESLDKLMDEADIRGLMCIKRAGLLTQFFDIKRTSLRSRVKIDPKCIARTERVNQMYSWRVSRYVRTHRPNILPLLL